MGSELVLCQWRFKVPPTPLLRSKWQCLPTSYSSTHLNLTMETSREFNRSVAQDPLSHVVKTKQRSSTATRSVKNRQPVATATEPSADGQHILNRTVGQFLPDSLLSALILSILFGTVGTPPVVTKAVSVRGSRCLQHSAGRVCVCMCVCVCVSQQYRTFD
jgi:hypothetical protein